MTSLRRALKASLTIEEKPPTVRPPHRGNNRLRATSDDSSRHHRRHGDDSAAIERQGPGSHSERNRAVGSSTRGQGGTYRRGRSAGDAEDASSEYGNNHKNGSDSDGSIANAGRGRSSVADRRQNDVKREKTEPVPVSPPRKSVIEAGHEAEEGSQIKVKFDTGHWFSGIISKVDKQRDTIVIDYDDGTKETSRIPDSDIVIYPWRPPGRRVRPRPLSQYQQELRAGGKVSGGGAHPSGSSRKHAVKTEPRATPSLRRKATQARDRGTGRKREPMRGGRSGAGHGDREGPKAVLSLSSFEEDDDESGGGDEADDEGQRWADGGTLPAKNNGVTSSRASRKNNRWQLKTSGKGAARGRTVPQRQAPQRKRPASGGGARKHGASKRQRVARNVAAPPVNDGGPSRSTSESEFEASEDEEELDDASLGIKAKARTLRVSGRRKLPSKMPPQKGKGGARRGSDGPSKTPGTETTTANRSPKPPSGSSAMSESFSSESDSSASSSSSDGDPTITVGSEQSKKIEPEAGQAKARTKVATVPAPSEADGEHCKREKDEGVQGAKEASLGRGKVGQQQPNDERPKEGAQRPDELAERTPMDNTQPVASRKPADSSIAVAAEPDKPNLEQSKAPRGWQESRSRQVARDRRDGAQERPQASVSTTANGREASETKGRGRTGRGQGSRGGLKAKPPLGRSGRLEARVAEGAQQRQQRQRADDACVHEASTSVPQKCAEEKQARSVHPSSSLRKSPRSKETPAPSRRDESTRDVLRHGVPEVAEAKYVPSAPDPPSATPVKEGSLRNDGVYGWEAPKQVAHPLITVAPGKNAGKVTADVEVRVADQKDGPSPSAQREVSKSSDGVEGSRTGKNRPSTPAELDKENESKGLQCQRAKCDDREGKPEPRSQSDADSADLKASRSMEASSKKSKGKLKNAAKSGDAAPVPVAPSKPDPKVEDPQPTSTDASPKHPTAADASAAIPKKPHPEDQVGPRVAVEKGPLVSARDASVAVRAETTTNDDPLTAPEVAEERVAGTMDSPTLSLAVEGAAAVTSSPHHSDGDAMELDSGMEDEALLPVDAALMRRLYSSDSEEDDPSIPAEMLGTIAPPKEEEAVQGCQRAMAAKVEADEEALPVDEGIRTLGTLKPKAAEGDTDQTELKRATKPARKRPRSEEKPGPGAKSDWPAPVVSRATKPDLEILDVNEVDAPNSCPIAAVARVQSEVESAEGTSDSALSAPVHATEDMGMLNVPEVGDAKAPTPSNEEGTVDGVDSLAAGFVASDNPAIVAEDESSSDHAEVSTNEMANTASGEHKEGDPVSGEDSWRGGQRGGVGAPPAAGRNDDRGDPEPVTTEENGGPDKVIRGKVEVGPEEIFESQERCRSSAAAELDGSSLAETSKTAEIPFTKELTAKDSGDTGPPLSLQAETHPGVVGKSGDEIRRGDYSPIAENAKGESRETPGDATAAEETVVEAPAVVEAVARKGANGRPKEVPEEDSKYEVEDGEDRGERENDKPSTVPNKHSRSDSGETHSGSDGGGASAEPRHVGRRRLCVTRFEPSMETDRNRSGQHRPERHERQAAVLATKRLAASAPIRRSSRGGRGQDSGARGRGGGRGRRGGRGGRGSRVVVRERQEESEDEDDDDDDDDDGDEEGVDWVQCDNCEKWWTLPSSVNADELPDVWHCRMQDWGKTVVDCLALKEPRGKGETGGAQTERKLAGKSAFRDSSAAPTSPASTTVTATSSANSQGAQASVAVPVAVAAAAEGSALEQVTAAAKAEAAVALVAAVATAAAAAIEATRTDSRPDTIAAVPTVAGGGNEGASELARCLTRPVSLVKPAQGGEAHLSANVAALANVPDKLPPEPPPSAPPNDDLEKKCGKVVEKPSAAARGKRKREGAVNFSSSDEDCARGMRDSGAGTRESGKTEDSRACSGAGRLGGSRGRGRRNSNSSMGRHAVAVLIKAAEARRDSEPTSEDVEVRAGRGGVSFNIRPRGIGGGNGVLRSGPSNEAVNQEQWVMCDHERCGKWRRVPPGVNLNGVDKWYCEMATWSPATANCEHPEDSTEMVVPLSTTTISGGGRGNGSAGGSAGYRGRRIGSRSSRTASEGSEGGAEEDRSWRRDGEGTSAERRWSDGGSAIGGGNGGRGRGRAKKDDLLWVQCDKCEKWRKLANGMRNEDLPEKWYCQMNTWSFANDCSFPDEYDAETNQANGDTITSWVVDTGGSGGGGGFGGGRVSGSGLLARGAGGINKKANGRLSYRDILFNNDGKLRPPYSAGPCASASAGYLFPRPGDVVASRVEESEASQYISPSRTGFHFSEKYCPVTGPERPPPRQHLLTASLKFTSVLTSPPLTRPSGEASGGPSCLPNGLVAQAPGMSSTTWVASAWDAPVRYYGWESSDAGDRSTIRPGLSKSNGAVELPPAPNGPMAMETGSTALRASLDPRRTSSPHYLRVGTYERQREERYLVLHYLKEATAPRSGKGTRSALHSNGITASRLLAAMRKRPWEGRPNASTPQEWRAWVNHLEPMLERHLRWLTVDGLAARLDSDGVAPEGGCKEEARFVAVDPNDGEAAFGFQAEGQRVFGHFAGGRGASAECDGVPGTSASSGVGLSMMTGGVRIMKSRPIKMVKPWR